MYCVYTLYTFIYLDFSFLDSKIMYELIDNISN